MKSVKTLLVLTLFFCITGINAQTYTYSAVPAIGTPTSCPAACGASTIGGTVKFKVTSVTASSFTFTISKCDESTAFTSNGTFYVGCDTDIQCNNISNAIKSTTVLAGVNSASVTVPASWYGNGTNSYWVGIYKSAAGNLYYCGLITISRISNDPLIPTAPGNINSSLNGNSIDISWSSSSEATFYKVYMSNDNGLSYGFMSTINSGTGWSYSPGSPGKHYCFKVVACNSSGCSQLSTTYSCQTIPNTDVCDPPANLGSLTSYFSALVSWTPSLSATDYEIKYRELGYDTYTTTFSSSSSFNLTNLNTNASYEFQVRSRCPNSNYSSFISTTFSTLTSTQIIGLSGDLSFGSINVGGEMSRTLTISNTGNSDLVVSQITLPASFSTDWNSGIISPGAIITANIKFTAGNIGNFGGIITVYSNKNSGINEITCSGSSGLPTCGNYSDCSGIENCLTDKGLPQEELFQAVQYLCNKGIIDKEQLNNIVGINDTLRRHQLAKMAFLSLFDGVEPAINLLPSDNCPSPYFDLQEVNTYYYRYAKALLYLEYGDGISPFSRNFARFNPGGLIQRLSVLKLLLETFNIPPATSGVDFTDLKSTDTNYGYARKAFELGIITGGSSNNVNPYAYCTRGEVFLMLYRLMTKIDNNSIIRPSQNEILDGFYITAFISPLNISSAKGIESGNFNHYSKSSFAIPGRNLSMNFEHCYNSYLATLPGEFFPVKPLGMGWSHTYNIFISESKGATTTDDRCLIHWPDGTIHVYKKTITYLAESSGAVMSGIYEGGNLISYIPESIGVYDELTLVSNTEFTLKTKNQLLFTFQKIGMLNNALFLTSIKDRNQNAISISYELGSNDLPRISQVTDGLNRKLIFSYSDNNMISGVTDPIGRIVSFEYTNNQLTAFSDAKGNKTIYTYGSKIDEVDLLMSLTLPKGNVITNTYKQQKLKSTELRGSLNSKTDIELYPNYNSSTGFISSRVNMKTQGSSNIISNYSFNSNGMINSLTDGNSTNISALYGSFSAIPWSVTNNTTGAQFLFGDIDAHGNVWKIMRLADGKRYTTNMTFNSFNDIESVQDARGNTIRYNYTGDNLTKITDGMGFETTFDYNEFGQPTSVTNPMNQHTTYDYDRLTGMVSRSTIPTGISTTSEYDLASRLKVNVAFNGQRTLLDYDANDNLLSTTQVAAHNGEDVVTQHVYDSNDNLTTILNALNRSTSFTYNNSTELLERESFEGAIKSYSYYSDGSLKTFTNPNGNSLSYVYDNLGRLTNNGFAGFSYNAITGNLETVSKDGRAITLAYDGFKRVISVLYDGVEVRYDYDEVDNIIKIIYPEGKSVIYSYDANNRMKTVTDWNNKITTYEYNNANQLVSVLYPNNVKTEYNYDDAGRQIGMTTKRGDNSLIASYTFQLDNMGNHITETCTEPFTTFPLTKSEEVTYSYDSSNRIVSAGNINFGFDENGNTKTKGKTSFGYDVNNNLTSTAGSAFNAMYSYDGSGMLRQSARNGIVSKYIMNILGMGEILAETDINGSVQNYYVYGLGLISRIKNDGRTNYYVYDFRGSTIAMTEASTAAVITHKYQYDEFGKVLQSEEIDLNRFRYVGKYGVMFENDELYYMHARFYDPTIGRFQSQDPIWSTNVYPYADNNSITNIDPKGRKPKNAQYLAGSIAPNPIVSASSNDFIISAASILESVGMDLNDIISIATSSNPKAGIAKYLMKKMGKEISMAALKSEIEIELKRPIYANKEYESALGDLMIACLDINFTDISDAAYRAIKYYKSPWKSIKNKVPWWQRLLSSPLVSE